LESIVFGKSLQLPAGDEGDESGEELGSPDAAAIDDAEGSLPAAFGEDEALGASPKPKARRKRKKKSARLRQNDKRTAKADASEDDEEPEGLPPGPAWIDPDDAELEVDLMRQNRTKKLRRFDKETTVSGQEYEQRLRDQFTKMNGSVGWAERRPGDKDEDASSGSDDDAGVSGLPATSAMPIADSGDHALKPHGIDIKCLPQVVIPPPSTEERAAVVQSLQFHPDSELMLTAGLDKTVRFWGVDGTDNARVAAYHFKQFPIMGASFTPDGDQVLLTGRDFKMWGLDVRTGTPMHIQHHSSQHHSRYRGLVTGPCPSDAPALRSNRMYAVHGDGGALLVCDVPSKQPVRTLRMRMPGVAAVFCPDRDTLFSADTDCNIYEWDLASGRCKQQVKAAWATGIESLAIRRVTPKSPTPLLAVGTVSGNIDLYDLSRPQLSSEPYTSIDNLTTMVTSLAFHPEGEVLLGASKFKKDQLRLIHSATATVFQNWPTAKTPLNRVTSVDFARQGGMLAMANEKGKVLIYQLRQYGKLA
jgi:U3 small nucleolar RNA-associated protein 18